MANQFKPGDVVTLKSNGPLMTVQKVEGGRVLCQWFDGSKPTSQYFEEAVLRPANPD